MIMNDKYAKKLTDFVLSLVNTAEKIVYKNSILLQSHIRKDHLIGGTTDSKLRKRTGKLSSSIQVKKSILTKDGITGGIEIGTNYGKLHFGKKGDSTVISAKAGKYLTIPTENALTPAGRLKGSAKDPIWGSTFISKGIIFGYKGGKSKFAGKVREIVPLFILKKSVKIPVRVDALELLQWLKPKIENDFEKELLNVNKN